jgi:hypothetical protein
MILKIGYLKIREYEIKRASITTSFSNLKFRILRSRNNVSYLKWWEYLRLFPRCYKVLSASKQHCWPLVNTKEVSMPK